MTLNNVLAFYSLAKLYKLAITSETSLAYIERCFQMVDEAPNFLHLDINTVVRILGSSELNNHSEIEVFSAAINWLEHDIEERSKYAKQLLLKVRLTLLSEHAFEHISNRKSLVCKNIELSKTLNEVLQNQKTLFLASTDKYITSRYCSQNKFNVLICGGRNKQCLVVRNVHQVEGNTLKYVKDVSKMKVERIYFEAVSLKGEVYAFGGHKKGRGVIKSVEKYSPSFNTWKKVADMFDKREYFCTCAFMDKIFILGAFYEKGNVVTSSCIYFDIRQDNFVEVSKMIHARMSAACVVFQGKIVISGGMENDNNELNSVESYDVFSNKWSLMPSTTNIYSYHSLVVVKDKLFVIGGDEEDCCEVFDNVCKKFVSLKYPPYTQLYTDFNKSLAVGNKIVVFLDLSPYVVCYDVDKDEWSEEPCELTEDLDGFSCAKLPLY